MDGIDEWLCGYCHQPDDACRCPDMESKDQIMTLTSQSLRALSEAATAGEWKSFGRDILAIDADGMSYNMAHIESRKGDALRDAANAELIAAMKTGLPEILEALSAHSVLLERIEGLEAGVRAIAGDCERITTGRSRIADTVPMIALTARALLTPDHTKEGEGE